MSQPNKSLAARVAEVERIDVDDALAELYAEIIPALYAGDVPPVALIGRGTSSPARGSYRPGEHLIEMDGRLVTADAATVDMIDPTSVADMLTIGAFHGVMCHEIGHSVHTVWPTDPEALASIPAGVARTAALLEEARMESRQIARRPQDRRWLRMAMRELVAADVDVDDPTWNAARVAALVLARVDGGTFDRDDVATIESAVRDRLGDDVLDSFRSLWLEALGLADGDFDGLCDVARRWLDVIDRDHDDDPEASDDAGGDESGSGSDSASGSGGGGEPGDDESSETDDPTGSDDPDDADDGADEDAPADDDDDADDDGDADGADGSEGADADEGDEPDDLTAAIGAALDDIADQEHSEAVEESAADDTADSDTEGRKAAELADRAERDAERASALDIAGEVFHGRGTSTSTSGVVGERPATSGERDAAITLERILRRVSAPEVRRSESMSLAPPGRLVHRRAVAAAAEQSRGSLPTVEVFKTTHRVRTAKPRPVVGLAFDVSGSMRNMTASMGSLSWILPHAFARIGGMFAGVTFGNTVDPITRPGAAPTTVPEMDARAGHESAGRALLALEGVLPLDDPGRVRLVVICSDNHWVDPDEAALADRRIAALIRSGCKVLSINTTLPMERPNLESVAIPDASRDPLAAVRLIGDRIVRLLSVS